MRRINLLFLLAFPCSSSLVTKCGKTRATIIALVLVPLLLASKVLPSSSSTVLAIELMPGPSPVDHEKKFRYREHLSIIMRPQIQVCIYIYNILYIQYEGDHRKK